VHFEKCTHFALPMMKVSDNQSELFDIVDENDHVIGQATRGEVHKNKNLIHRSIGIIVFNKKSEIFLQQRSSTKDTDPLKWTISASGHVLSGDSYEDTAKRELVEELGVNLRIEMVVKYLCYAPQETEMQKLFRAASNGPFDLHSEEIKQGKFFAQDELIKTLKQNKLQLSYSGKMSLSKIGWL